MRSLILVVFIFGGLSLFSSSAFSDEHHHHGDHNTALTLNKGEKWQADDALRKRMAEIKSVVNEHSKKVQKNKLENKEYKAIAQSIENSVQAIFKECELEPEADHVLHIILGDIIEGYNLMKEPKDKNHSSHGFVKVQTGLSNYQKYFK